ncbi:hypothetical protein BC941DRAFT_410988 [Chlamydoabsidia padenii]|nr:hypothetical protein BC941DRAFT_410988 [Chlamydoabsidia padenii]
MFTPTIKYKRVNEGKSVIETGETDSVAVNCSSSVPQEQHKGTISHPVQKAKTQDTNQSQNPTTTTTLSPISSSTQATEIPTPAITFEEKQDATITVDPNDDERILITLSDGTTQYTADRYCPHAGADLTYLGQVDEDEYPPEIGPILLCTLHYWEYALKKQGRGANGVATINACPVNDTSGLDCPVKKGLDW